MQFTYKIASLLPKFVWNFSVWSFVFPADFQQNVHNAAITPINSNALLVVQLSKLISTDFVIVVVAIHLEPSCLQSQKAAVVQKSRKHWLLSLRLADIPCHFSESLIMTATDFASCVLLTFVIISSDSILLIIQFLNTSWVCSYELTVLIVTMIAVKHAKPVKSIVIFVCRHETLPSMLPYCWLGDTKGSWPSGVGG